MRYSWRAYLGAVSTPVKLCFAASVACLILAKAANIAIPILYGILTDWLSRKTGDIPGSLFLVVLAYAGLRVASFSLANFRDLLFLPVAQQIGRKWLQAVLGRVLATRDPSVVAAASGVNAKSIERGFKELEAFCRTIFFSVLPTGLEIIIQTVMIGILFDLTLGAIPLATSIAYTLVTVALARRRYPLIDAANEQDELLVDGLSESLDALEEIRVYRLEPVRARLLDGLVNAYHAARGRSDRVLFMQFTLQGVILAAGYSLTAYLTTLRVLDQTLSMGGFVTVNIYLLQLFIPLSTVGQIYHEAVSSSAALRRVGSLLAELQGPRDPPSPTRPSARPEIAIDRLSYRYAAGEPALRDVSLDIPFGARVGLLGPTGSGKSTLARVLCGLLSAPGDRLRIGGAPMSSLSEEALRETIVLVSQRPVIFRDTVLGNLCPDGRADRAEIGEALRICGIDKWLSRLPHGLETPLDRGGGNISGGQRQQICIARALLRRPRILILDEATSNLDRVTEEALLNVLLRPGGESTRIVISHRASALRNADFLIVLDAGRVAAIGDHAKLLEESRLYRELLGSDRDAEVPA